MAKQVKVAIDVLNCNSVSITELEASLAVLEQRRGKGYEDQADDDKGGIFAFFGAHKIGMALSERAEAAREARCAEVDVETKIKAVAVTVEDCRKTTASEFRSLDALTKLESLETAVEALLRPPAKSGEQGLTKTRRTEVLQLRASVWEHVGGLAKEVLQLGVAHAFEQTRCALNVAASAPSDIAFDFEGLRMIGSASVRLLI